ncbi:MAG: thioredoxin family protein [Candidatus Gracilibacteria bacterium]|nr:thioredoxin family protein [Candidatus Gracilibacteria bacterium]
MKTTNLKTILVFTISALLFALLASCSKQNIENTSFVSEFVSDSNMQDIDIASDTMLEENQTMDSEEMLSDKQGVYADYTPEALKNASGNIVLFFHADWCPTCIAIEKDILSKEVPSGLTILKVDYDTATDLKQKYSILTQSSFVQVDNKGNMIKRWISGRGLDDIIKKVQ